MQKGGYPAVALPSPTHWPVPPFVLPAAVGHLEYASCAAGSNVVGPRRDQPDAPTRDHALERFGHDRQLDVASPGSEVSRRGFLQNGYVQFRIG